MFRETEFKRQKSFSFCGKYLERNAGESFYPPVLSLVCCWRLIYIPISQVFVTSD